MKLSTIGIAGLSALLGLTLMNAGIAAEPADGNRRPAFEGGRGPAPGGMSGRFFQRRGPDLARQLERMDTDDDGQISEEEFVEFRLARLDDMFERRDRNDDGLIDLDENPRPDLSDRPNRRSRANRPELDREDLITCVRETIADFAPDADMDFAERFDSVDTDGSGSLTLAEVSAALEAGAHETFGRIDTDDNGFITAAELKAHHQARLEVRREVRECARGLV